MASIFFAVRAVFLWSLPSDTKPTDSPFPVRTAGKKNEQAVLSSAVLIKMRSRWHSS